MKRVLYFLFLIPLSCHAQDSLKTELQMILLNSADSSLVAYAFTYPEDFNSNLTFVDSNNHIILDSLLKMDYHFEYDYPFFSPRFEPDSSYAKPFIKYLSSSDIGSFLRQSHLRFYLVHYGNVAYKNIDELSVKYGLEVMNMGCVRDHRADRYMFAVENLLNARNGIGWMDQYHKELREMYDK